MGFEGARFLLSETEPGRLGPSAAEVAFVGRSNVGKSALINALLRADLARVSGAPGCTRTINVYLAGKDRWLVDLPGYGFAAGPASSRAGWGAMIEGYLTGRPALRMVFVLVDAELGPTKLDAQMLRWLQAQGLPWSVVAAKADRVRPSLVGARKRAAASASGAAAEDLCWVSAFRGDGIRELRAAVWALLSDARL